LITMEPPWRIGLLFAIVKVYYVVAPARVLYGATLPDPRAALVASKRFVPTPMSTG
jgi:hypothetical protein